MTVKLEVLRCLFFSVDVLTAVGFQSFDKLSFLRPDNFHHFHSLLNVLRLLILIKKGKEIDLFKNFEFRRFISVKRKSPK